MAPKCCEFILAHKTHSPYRAINLRTNQAQQHFAVLFAGAYEIICQLLHLPNHIGAFRGQIQALTNQCHRNLFGFCCGNFGEAAGHLQIASQVFKHQFLQVPVRLTSRR